jgi:phosphate transport system permease protein
MSFFLLSAILLALTALGFHLGRRRSFALAERAGGLYRLNSRPAYYGTLTALWCLIPAIVILCFWIGLEPNLLTDMVVAELPESIRELPEEQLSVVVRDIKTRVSTGVVWKNDPATESAARTYNRFRNMSRAAMTVMVIGVALLGILLGHRTISPRLRARNIVEKLIGYVLILCSSIAIVTTVGIVLSVLYEAIRFFQIIPIQEFVTGLSWSPQMAIRDDQVGSSGAFGAIPVFAGTLLISAIAMAVAVPIGLLSAIYLSEYAGRRFRAVAKPLMEILAGIPTVVYGFFAALVVAPMIRDTGALAGMEISSESALAAGLVMGVMIIPFVSSLSDDVINAVPQSLRDGAYGLGSTQSETIRLVILPAALPGIVGSILLAVSRAIGETMIVVMAAGLSANLTLNPLKTVTTVTVQIVTLLVGDQEFDSPKTLAAFALGLMLFIVTLILNVIALYVVRKYREQYE